MIVTSSVLYSRQIRDTVNWIFCEQMLVCYISVFRDTFWPNGKLAPHVMVRTDSERSETKERAQQKLLDNIPGSNWTKCKHDPYLLTSLIHGCVVWCTWISAMWNVDLLISLLSIWSFMSDALANLVGQQNARYGIIKIFNALQEASANKHLLYVRTT